MNCRVCGYDVAYNKWYQIEAPGGDKDFFVKKPGNSVIFAHLVACPVCYTVKIVENRKNTYEG